MDITTSITAAQYAAIEAAAAKAKPPVKFDTEPGSVGGSPTFIWQSDHALVGPGIIDPRAPFAGIGLEPELARNVDGSEQADSRHLPKLVKWTKKDGRTTKQIVERLNTLRGIEGRFSVNNLLYVTHGDGANLCPANEPTPVRPYPETIPYPPPGRVDTGAGVRVHVIDTGLSSDWKVNHPWLYDENRNPQTEVDGDEEPDTFLPNGQIDQHAGHGVFIAGLIRCVAPKTTVHVSSTMRWAGAMHEFEVARAIVEQLDKTPAPHIISLSAGCLINTDTSPVPQAMLGVMRRLSEPGCNTLLVVAAGNDGHGPDSNEVFYPAAFAGVDPFDEFLVTVGALREERDGRACFSNFADWVTVYEDGENLVNAFPTGPYVYREPLSGTTPPQCVYHHPPLEPGCTCVTAPAQGSLARFRGMASWSGTSFSAPIVVGRVVRHMTENPAFKDNPRAAMKNLLKQRTTISDISDGFPLGVFPRPVSG